MSGALGRAWGLGLPVVQQIDRRKEGWADPRLDGRLEEYTDGLLGPPQSGVEESPAEGRQAEGRGGERRGGEKEAGRGCEPSVEEWRKEGVSHSFLQSNGSGREPAQCDARARAASAHV